jgi:hypothetical protein
MDTIDQGTPVVLLVTTSSQNPHVHGFPEGVKGTFLNYIMNGDEKTNICAINIGGSEYTVPLEDISIVDIHENDWVLVKNALSEIRDGDTATVFTIIEDMKQKKLLPVFFRRLLTRGHPEAFEVMYTYTNDPVIREFFLAAKESQSQDCE